MLEIILQKDSEDDDDDKSGIYDDWDDFDDNVDIYRERIKNYFMVKYVDLLKK